MLTRLLLAVCAGLAMWLAFPGYDQWWLAPISVAALSLATTGAGALRGALLGFAAGLAFFLPVLEWSGIFVGNLPWIALSVVQSLYLAGLGALTGSWGVRTGARSIRAGQINPVIVALAWTVSETVRGTFPYGGFPWGRIAFSQADAPVLGAVSLVGTPGIAFLVALTGGSLAWGALRLVTAGESDEPAGRRLLPGRAAVASTVLVVLAGSYLLPMLVPRPVSGETVSVLGVQGNVPQMGLDFNAQRRAVLDNHARWTHEAAGAVAAGELAPPDLVVWPENASDIDPIRNADAAEVIRVATEAIDAPVLLGAVLRVEEGLHNAQMLWLPGEGPVDSYVKRRPVPFAEYIPHRNFYRFFTDAVDLVGTDFMPGAEIGTVDVDTRAGRVRTGIAICFEIILDEVVRDTVIDGAQILIVPTNNATFGFSDESVQQLAASRVKAVEHGRAVVHLSNVGVSAFILPDGSMLQQTELFTAALLSADLPLRTEQTLATRLGAWPEWAAMVALVITVLVRVGQRRRDILTQTTPARARTSG